MKYLQLARLSVLKDLHADNAELAHDLETILEEVSTSEAPEEKIFREAAELSARDDEKGELWAYWTVKEEGIPGKDVVSF